MFRYSFVEFMELGFQSHNPHTAFKDPLINGLFGCSTERVFVVGFVRHKVRYQVLSTVPIQVCNDSWKVINWVNSGK